MSGILLIAVLVTWLLICRAISKKLTRNIKSQTRQTTSKLAIFSILFLAPFSDELIGAFQFSSLCDKYAVVEIDEQNAKNRTVIVEPRSSDTYAEGTALKIRIDPYVYRDIETNKVIVRYHILQAKGGWFIRLLGISETNAPLLFNPACEPENVYGFKKTFNIKVVN
ncbi:hypothetical protein [Pseudomonas sp. zfem003]|uniref:hypothetical protein n=1 Tax=Pseudomonas sp. zfem003 TaxID=3078198 RepID=UPI002929A232|nr:hypothetical protein [Pseudomonas sp. zfem003]MDU9398910.1 hypothetical protein [Pseudomonas sp. zfem003]